MNRLTLILLGVGSVVAVTTAGAAGLGTISGGTEVNLTNTGSVNVVTSSCTDPLTLQYIVDGSQITGVRLTANGTSCEGQTARVDLSDEGTSAYQRYGTAVFEDGVARINTLAGGNYNVATNPLKKTFITVQKLS